MATIQLQNIGRVPAVQASQLKKGDKVMFNFGETQTVKEITKISKSTYKIDWIVSSGRVLSSQKRGTTLMARLPFK